MKILDFFSNKSREEELSDDINDAINIYNKFLLGKTQEEQERIFSDICKSYGTSHEKVMKKWNTILK